MTKPVAVLTESPADLSQELIERYGVHVMPMTVILGDREFLDGVDITPDDIYAYYREKRELAKTAANAPEKYRAFFQQFLDKGMEVVFINLSSGISAACQNAAIAAGEMEGVYTVDSEQLSSGIALLVIKACEMRDQGFPAAEIAQAVRAMRGLVHTSFVLDTLTYLHKGGRCSGLELLGANLLGIKPCIQMSGGKLDVGKKYRGKLVNVYVQYALDQLAGRDDLDLDRIFITHSGIGDAELKKLRAEVQKNTRFKEILICRAGGIISAHCGPNTMGVLFMTQGLNQ